MKKELCWQCHDAPIRLVKPLACAGPRRIDICETTDYSVSLKKKDRLNPDANPVHKTLLVHRLPALVHPIRIEVILWLINILNRC